MLFLTALFQPSSMLLVMAAYPAAASLLGAIFDRICISTIAVWILVSIVLCNRYRHISKAIRKYRQNQIRICRGKSAPMIGAEAPLPAYSKEALVDKKYATVVEAKVTTPPASLMENPGPQKKSPGQFDLANPLYAHGRRD